MVQYNNFGDPTHCWKLEETSIANEHASDGVYWVDGESDNLVHISGWYNRVQVKNNRWENAAKHLGVDLDSCTDGKYKQKSAEDNESK